MSETSSFMGAAWGLRAVDEDLSARLGQELGLHPVLARCMALRGVTASDAGLRLMSPDWSALHDPYSMLGMQAAVARLRVAAQERQPVRVVTDYDVDGTTSSLILQSALRQLSVQLHGPSAPDLVSYHIPDRMEEGYGFSVRAAEQAAADGVPLVVTADIGVRDHASVARARALGVDVIVCDHHLPEGEQAPVDATAVLCPPQRGCSYPNPQLAACGVSLKLAQALLEDHPRRDLLLRSMTKLAALGTVADMVDLLTPENRALVSLGLEALNQDAHSPGLQALLDVSKVTKGEVHAEDLAWRLGPRVNAAGRVASARAVIELFTTRDPSRARQRAEELNQLNDARKGIQDHMMADLKGRVNDAQAPLLMAWGEERRGWHRGVAGIVAARLRDTHGQPAVVAAISPEGEAIGSVRCPPGVHAVTLLEGAANLLTRFGGHPGAAGFALPADRLPALEAALMERAAQLRGPNAPERRLELDAEIPAAQLNRGLYQDLQRLAPHGKGNPRPRLWVRGVRLGQLRALKDRHLKAELRQADGRRVDLLWWDGLRQRSKLEESDQLDLAGCLETSSWQGVERLQLVVEDARRS